MSEGLDRAEFVAGYLAEADELLRAADAALVAVDEALRKGEPHHRLVRELFRQLHTLKGLSAMVGVDAIVDISHEMESLLKSADKSGGRVSAVVVDVLVQGKRAIEQRVAAFAQDKPVAPAPPALLASFQDAASSLSAAPSSTLTLTLEPDIAERLSRSEADELAEALRRGRRALRFDFVPSPTSTAAGLSITTVRERLSSLATLVKVVPRSLPKSDAAPAGLSFVLLFVTDAADVDLARAVSADADAFVSVGATTAAEVLIDDDVGSDGDDGDDGVAVRSDSIRVDAWRLDDALEKLSSLVVSRFRMARAVNVLRDRSAALLGTAAGDALRADVRELQAIVGDSGRQLQELRGAITKARMVSVATLLERVPLIVRGMSRATGKPVRLVVDAGRAELDKAVADRVFPAIVHLVRNAVDHAVEPADEREKAGKPREATIRVSCFERGSQLSIDIEDDGRGVDAVAVARKAGVAVQDDAQDLLALLTRPGLSTLDHATAHSGRGLGMDIVKRVVVDVLGGDLSMTTRPGLGTRFTLQVPLSVSIVDSFAFECGAQPFVVPVASVEEIVELRPDLVFRAPLSSLPQGSRLPSSALTMLPTSAAAASAASSFGKNAVRLLRRRDGVVPLFRLAELFSLESVRNDTTFEKALIVRRQGQAWAFAVDRMLGQQEVVVRPLEDPLLQVRGVSGTTDLGDGKPTLVVDLLGLTTGEA